MPRQGRHAVATLVAAVVVVAAPRAVEAQVLTQPYLSGGWVDGVTGQFGINLLRDLTSSDDDALVSEPGPALNGFLSAGVRTRPTQATGFFGLGLMFPKGDPNLAYYGPVGVGSVHPWGWGGGVRVAGGFGAGLAWLTAGVIKLDDRNGIKPLASLDLTFAFLCDVTPIC
jgi:hypothetical protein